MQTKLKILAIIPLIFLLSACTANTTQNTQQSPSPQSSPQTTPTESTTPSPTPKPTNPKTTIPTNKPSQQTNQTPSAIMTHAPKSEVKSYSTGNATTNINITSNGTNVKIITKNGKRYAQLNGQEVPLDENGCYKYDQNGTKIHACLNDNRFKE